MLFLVVRMKWNFQFKRYKMHANGFNKTNLKSKLERLPEQISILSLFFARAIIRFFTMRLQCYQGAY